MKEKLHIMNKTNKFMQNLNLYDGIIDFNDFDIDENVPFEEQEYSYKEDILQISYGDRFTLDVGWYPELNPRGNFIVYAVEDENWDPPLKKIKARTLGELKKAIETIAFELSNKARIELQKNNTEITDPTKFISKINILGGKITFNAFDININSPLSEQANSLRENMLQIEYGRRFLVDVGWSSAGHFSVKVIQDGDWAQPISEIKCNNLTTLKGAIESSAKLIHSRLKIRDLPLRDVEHEEFH